MSYTLHEGTEKFSKVIWSGNRQQPPPHTHTYPIKMIGQNIKCSCWLQKASEYDQEILQSHTADQPRAL